MSGALDVGLAAALLLFASLYLGIGWSLVLFSHPLAPRLTPDTYHLPFVEPVRNATRFLTGVTSAMLLVGAVLLARAGDDRWMPLVYLAATVAATLLTVLGNFPLNKELTAGIRDPQRLRWVLGRWMRLNVARVVLWTLQWAVVTAWFVLELV